MEVADLTSLVSSMMLDVEELTRVDRFNYFGICVTTHGSKALEVRAHISVR